MPLDPQLRNYLDAASSAPQPDGIAGLRESLDAGARKAPLRAVENLPTEDFEIPVKGGTIRSRLYLSPPTGSRSLTVFFHGGGFVAGSIATHDAACRELVASSKTDVLSVAYRLAPEYPIPVGLDDAYTALLWAQKNLLADRLLAIAGDSAGANIAFVTAVRARDRSGPSVSALLLMYPATDMNEGSYLSRKENAEGYGLTENARQMLMNIYAPTPELKANSEVSIVRTPNFSDLPPTLVVTCEFDPLRDEGVALAEALQKGGTATETWCADGMIHGFINLTGYSGAAARYLDDIGRWLGDRLR